MEQTEFKFPDEQGDFKIEVVDDTPEPDKGRTPLEPEKVEKLEKDEDLNFDALGEHAESVRRKMNQLKKVWHDERRAKEAADRERQEALKFAEVQLSEVKKLRSQFGEDRKRISSELVEARKAEVVATREKLKAAVEAGDAEAIAAAQEMLTDAKFRLREVETEEKTLQKTEDTVEKPQQPERQPTVDAKAEAWRQKNSWFGSDPEMTALALGLHQKLVQANASDPNYARSDEYYRQIDQTMRKRFPEYFADSDPPPAKDPAPAKQKPATVVAPATRSSAPRKVVLSASQVAIAKRLGLSNEQYAKELMKLESNNG